MEALPQALLLSLVAGATIPLGGLLARFERIHPNWLEAEFRHSVIAFGGGALLAAVALVLIPEGSARLPHGATLVAFVAGGVVFMLADRALARRGGAGAQLMAMLLDFIPEAIALGATLAAGQGGGVLLALLIALQNGPEGFNAYREMRQERASVPGDYSGCSAPWPYWGHSPPPSARSGWPTPTVCWGPSWCSPPAASSI